jgi:hypothetical protein
MANTPRPEPSPTPGARSGIAPATPLAHGPTTAPSDPGAIIAAPNGPAPSAREDADGVAAPARNCPPQRDLWPDVCHVGPPPPIVAPTPAKAAEAPTAAKSDAPSPAPAGAPEAAVPSPAPAPTTDWQGVLEPSPTPSPAISTPTPAPTAAASASSLDPAFLGLGLALLFAIGLVAALLYLRRATGRIAEVEAGLAEALGKPDATLEDALAFILSHEPEFDDSEEGRENEFSEADEPPPDPAAVAERPSVDVSRLGVQASYCLDATAARATELLDDPEFAIFARRLDLVEGSRAAAQSLRELGGVDPAAYRQGMYERLRAGVFDGALTSLDVLGAYAHPDGGDWRAFLAHLEAAEALLTLALADCEIEVFRPPLLEPVERATLTDATFGSDARGLGSIRSATRRARTRMAQLGDDDRDIVFDCYSPGWRSAVFGSRGAFIAFFDPSSMTGAPP